MNSALGPHGHFARCLPHPGWALEAIPLRLDPTFQNDFWFLCEVFVGFGATQALSQVLSCAAVKITA